MVQSVEEKGENGIGASSTVTLPLSLLRDSGSKIPSVSQSGGGHMCSGCGWATGAHMTEFSTNGTGAHVAGSLRMSRCGQSTEGADVLGVLGMNMVCGPTLEASYDGGGGRSRIWDVDGIGAGSGISHNHLQSSGQSNASRAHCRSSSSVNSRPAPLSWSSVPSVTFSRGKGVQSARGTGVCLVSQLGEWVDCSVGRGH